MRKSPVSPLGNRAVSAGRDVRDSAAATGDGAIAVSGGLHLHGVGVDELQEQLTAALTGTPADRHRLSRQPFGGVPPRLACFIGRKVELDQLDVILAGGRSAVVTQETGQKPVEIDRIAVHGLGGVGKTSIAVEYAYRYRQRYSGIWWCPAETRIGLLTSLAGLARELGAATADEADIERAAKAALRSLAERRATFLLICDNATSPEEIADLLPTAGARVLITSRFSDWGGWADEVPLDVMPPAEAATFLETRAGRQDEEGAKALAQALGFLPLALDHAAAYCKRSQASFADYTALAGSMISAAPRGAVYPQSVAATFSLAIAAAVQQCPAAEALMSYLAQCAPERIAMTLVQGAIENDLERIQALLALTEVSLVKHDPFEDGTPAVTVHRLVQAVAKATAETSGRAAPATERVALRLAAIYPKYAYRNSAAWPLCAKLTSHLLALNEKIPASAAGGMEWAELLNRAGSYFHGRTAYSRAEPLLQNALEIREKARGPDDPYTATSLNNLALLLQSQGDFAGARPLLERALAIYEKARGPDHPDTATSLSNLAVLQSHDDLAAARPLLERAVAIWEASEGDDGSPRTRRSGSGVATSLNNLASVLQEQGDLAAARPLLQRALAIFEEARGPDHRDTATSLNNLASLIRAQGDLAGARPLFERALAIYEKALGIEHPDTAWSANNLAVLLRDMGCAREAKQLMASRNQAIMELSPGKALYSVGSWVKVADRQKLDQFLQTWQYYNPLTQEQLECAGESAIVYNISVYRGSDPLYVLKGVPGVWHEECLAASPQEM
jgi:tetratricopeptide (TPR) repeat protein